MYTTKDASVVLGVLPQTVTRHIERGNLLAEKIGRDYLIPEQELERFQQARRKGGRPRKDKKHD